MNIFKRIVAKEFEPERRLGNPLDKLGSERRLNYFASLTGGRGFRMPKQSPATDAQGRTRGERKRAMRDMAIAKMKEQAAERAAVIAKMKEQAHG